MSIVMEFPDTVDEFMEQYKMTDTECVYSNGIEYVPIFRMKQWFEHLEAKPKTNADRIRANGEEADIGKVFEKFFGKDNDKDINVPCKTNADRIRSMTDEELASVITDDWCEIVCSGTDYLCDGTCEQHVLKWLKEEVKE